MKVTAKSIKAQLKKIWPQIAVMWLPDKYFEVPTLEEVKNKVAQCRVHKEMDFEDEISDCDDFAMQLHAEIKRLSISDRQEYHWPFGEAFGIKWRGDVEKHTANIFVAQEGIYLLEPQTNDIWKARPGNDIIYFVKM